MKLVFSLLGVVLLIVAAVYFLMPADQLPSFLPGHEAGVMRVHSKHGIVAGAAGIVLLVAGWWIGRRESRGAALCEWRDCAISRHTMRPSLAKTLR